MPKAFKETIIETSKYLEKLQQSKVHIKTTGKLGQRHISVDTKDTSELMSEVIQRLAELGYIFFTGLEEEEKTFSRKKQ